MLLLFGKNGQVARELQALASVRRVEFHVCSREEADFQDPAQVLNQLSQAPVGTCVINAAAYTQVDQAESDAETARIVNAITPGLIAEECARRNLRLIHLSTDYVFSGEKLAPYDETDPTAPLNVYGETKRQGERQVLQAFPQALVLRTSWVFSGHGKNFVTTMLRAARERKELSVVADQWGGPTAAAAIARTCLNLANQISLHPLGSFPAGLYHYSGNPATTWYHFAEEIFRQAHRNVVIRPIPTAQYSTPARRPRNSRLSCHRILQDYGISQPDWKQDLADVLEQLESQN